MAETLIMQGTLTMVESILHYTIYTENKKKRVDSTYTMTLPMVRSRILSQEPGVRSFLSLTQVSHFTLVEIILSFPYS